MNRLEIKAQRTRLGYTQQEVAERMGMKLRTYQSKECGYSKFREDEKLALARVLELTIYQVNDFLFDGKLPIGKV